MRILYYLNWLSRYVFIYNNSICGSTTILIENLKGKKSAVFDTSIEKDFGKVLKKQIGEKAPDVKLVDTKFSGKVQSMKVQSGVKNVLNAKSLVIKW